MNIYLICNDKDDHTIDLYREQLEEDGNTVYLANEILEFDGASANFKVMQESDRIDVFWNKDSLNGCFELGMAFALYKPMRLVCNWHGKRSSKVFVNIIETCEKLSKITNQRCSINQEEGNVKKSS
jgi:hypothetical protein